MQKTNYNKLMEELFAQYARQGKTPTLLLHACCAPCTTYCLTRLIGRADVTLFYANDNITDPDEWQKRLGELEKLVHIVNEGQFEVAPVAPLKLVVANFAPQRFFNVAQGLEQQPEGGERCRQCFTLRLADAANYAQANGFELFGTTLTVSPYKNSEVINEIGFSLQNGVRWLPSSFKKQNGYNESVRLSAKYGLYRQHYCGCAFSKQNAD